jgi:DNA ligase (NAD+)
MLKPLFESGRIRTIADLYSLKVSDLTRFDGVQEKSAKKALDNLLAIKSISLAKFIGGFAIENIGEDLTQRVVDEGFDSLDKIKNAAIYQISKVDGFADITAEYLLNGVNKLYSDMQEVLNTGKITIKEVRKIGGKFEGMTFCFTGKLNTMKRAEAEQLVKDHGGEPKSSVVANLSYLITNSSEPTAKYVKAQKQGTKVINEDEFLNMIE